ncbi:metal-dependent hydrolase [Nocardia neocaledoniensis]|uniref:metal-dependent hydrolase n=1 Tax=Nocardia neocaledoniensis TaxID=236511 RepID=UPI002459068F|nr:metal-dependent hydrolase [Nocardia neocaledoniensis]
MSTLKVRKPPFTFEPDSTPFLWQPANPDFSELCNAMSFAAPAFERYIVMAIQQAAPRLKGTPMEREAKDFLQQEAQHARMHRRHVACLVKQHPMLAQTQAKIDQAYSDLFESESLEFHLAYMADIEATFTPLFGTMLNNEPALFRGGADHVASLFIWHFMEEIEHRSSAFAIYEAAVGRPWERTRQMPKAMRHIMMVMQMIADDFSKYIPAADRGGASDTSRGFVGTQAFRDIPRRQQLRILYRIMLSQLPFHRPDRQPIPQFTAEWYGAESEGRDITRWYATAQQPR